MARVAATKTPTRSKRGDLEIPLLQMTDLEVVVRQEDLDPDCLVQWHLSDPSKKFVIIKRSSPIFGTAERARFGLIPAGR